MTKSDPKLLAQDLCTLNTMVLDKIEEIKIQRKEIDDINLTLANIFK